VRERHRPALCCVSSWFALASTSAVTPNSSALDVYNTNRSAATVPALCFSTTSAALPLSRSLTLLLICSELSSISVVWLALLAGECVGISEVSARERAIPSIDRSWLCSWSPAETMSYLVLLTLISVSERSALGTGVS
jgi:hypothetical protein